MGKYRWNAGKEKQKFPLLIKDGIIFIFNLHIVGSLKEVVSHFGFSAHGMCTFMYFRLLQGICIHRGIPVSAIKSHKLKSWLHRCATLHDKPPV